MPRGKSKSKQSKKPTPNRVKEPKDEVKEIEHNISLNPLLRFQESLIVSTSENENSNIWDPNNLSLLHSFQRNTPKTKNKRSEVVTTLGEYIIGIERERAIYRIYNPEKEEVQNIQNIPEKRVEGGVRAVGVLDMGIIIGGTKRGELVSWDAYSGLPLAYFSGHLQGISVIYVDNMHSLVFTASEEGVIHIWCALHFVGSRGVDIGGNIYRERAGPVRSLYGHSMGVTGLSTHPATGTVISSSMDGSVKIWDMATANCTRTFIPHQGDSLPLFCMCHSHTYIYCGMGRDSQQVVCFRDNNNNNNIPQHDNIVKYRDEGYISHICISLNNIYILAGTSLGDIRVLHPPDLSELRCFQVHKSPITNLFSIYRPSQLYGLNANPKNAYPLTPYIPTNKYTEEEEDKEEGSRVEKSPKARIIIGGVHNKKIGYKCSILEDICGGTKGILCREAERILTEEILEQDEVI